jgi:uridine kinase
VCWCAAPLRSVGLSHQADALSLQLDHGVQEQHILFVVLLASAKGGIHALHRAFPRVKIVVAGIDPDLKKRRIKSESPPPGRACSAARLDADLRRPRSSVDCGARRPERRR